MSTGADTATAMAQALETKELAQRIEPDLAEHLIVLPTVEAAHGSESRYVACECGWEGADHHAVEDAMREWASHIAMVAATVARRPWQIGEDCLSVGFSGQGRCIEPAILGGFCEAHTAMSDQRHYNALKED